MSSTSPRGCGVWRTRILPPRRAAADQPHSSVHGRKVPPVLRPPQVGPKAVSALSYACSAVLHCPRWRSQPPVEKGAGDRRYRMCGRGAGFAGSRSKWSIRQIPCRSHRPLALIPGPSPAGRRVTLPKRAVQGLSGCTTKYNPTSSTASSLTVGTPFPRREGGRRVRSAGHTLPFFRDCT